MAIQMSLLARKSLLAFIAVAVTFFGERSFAKQQDPNEPTDFFEMSVEELMEVEVVSASRQVQKMGELSVPVSVITAEDIHYSGVTTIPEILQFAPGVDVRRVDRQRYAVGVRGLFGIFSDRTLILIDGRPARDPIHGTTHWENLPILTEDIERIEIVRGPGGAAWGSNAFTGVINIITKKTDRCLGGLISTTVNEFGDSLTHLRYGHTQGQWSWKVSAGYEDVEDSDAAGAGKYHSSQYPVIGFDSYSTRDWGRFWKLDTQAEYRVGNQTRWSFDAAHSSGQQGDFEFMRYFPRRDILTEYTRLFTRLDHQFDKDTSGYIQWFGNFWNTHCRVITDQMRHLQNDLEGQVNFKPADNHTMSVGGNVRWNRIQTDNQSPINENIVGDDDEYWTGLFLMDRWSVTDRLTIEGQMRVDHYSETTTDWSTRLTTLYALDEQRNHILRGSFARGFRSPSLILRNLYFESFGGATLFSPSPDAHNEGTYTLETGYIGKLSENLQLNVDGYYQRFERLFGLVITPGFPTNATFKNIDGADAYGGECSLTYHHCKGRLTAWYAYNGLETDQIDQSTRSFPPAAHKAGLTGRLFLNSDWTVNSNYVFQNGVEYNPSLIGGLHSFNRLDLTLSRKFAKGSGEFMIGVIDVLNETTDPVFEAGHFTAHETPGRMFFARLQLRF
jgi:outer membrane receptor for ferrienterochelin and colicin